MTFEPEDCAEVPDRGSGRGPGGNKMRDFRLRMVLAVTAVAILGAVAPQQLSAQAAMKQLADGQEVKVLGIINTRNGDTFTMTTLNNTDRYTVELTPSVSVKSNTKGVFRGGKDYEVSYLLRGLRVEVEGRGNGAGNLVAKS